MIGRRLTLACIMFLVILPGCAKKNHPPEVLAAPSGPASGRTGMDCPFWACATDPDDEDKVSVRFDWGDGDTSNWSGFVHSGDSSCKAHTYATPSTFFVRAQARDLDRALSDWSSACSVVVLLDSNLPPQTPSVPSGPDYGQVYSTYYFHSSAVDPDSDSVSIRFAWGDGDTSSWSLYVRSGDDVTSSHAYADSGTFLVAAQARDERGRTSEWSAPHQMEVPGGLVIDATGTRTDSGTVTDFSYSFSHDVTLNSLTIDFPMYGPVTDPDAPGPKTGGTVYHSDGWNCGGGQMPTGEHVLDFEGTWGGDAFDIEVTVEVN